ncbi:hypothetical protein H5410_062765 [Solanum commersonii]|uniref:RNase H type-1 domain-containing protein n=1 Tax=Solanum commersonii TaxID=4109 RepID=A0A9J5WCF6_SOLCO|nr:hypothetical protein H5410_062765 [Solanum commersonii]
MGERFTFQVLFLSLENLERCCSIPEVETTKHLFLKGEVAEEIWNHYARAAERYRVNFSFKIVRWFPPPINWVKCNTDEVSMGNPGLSSTTFCIRDHLGNLVVAKGFKLQDSTNLVAEARAIR